MTLLPEENSAASRRLEMLSCDEILCSFKTNGMVSFFWVPRCSIVHYQHANEKEAERGKWEQNGNEE